MLQAIRKAITVLRRAKCKQARGWYAFDKKGRRVMPTGKTACSFCAAGLLWKRLTLDEWNMVTGNYGSKIVNWNDTDKLTFKQIADRLEALVAK